MAKKTEGEWTARTLAEHAVSKSVVWRAQISTAPDGKEFAGVRKYIIKADGTEIADRAGFNFPYDGATIGDNVDFMIQLLTALKGGTVRVRASKTGPWVFRDGLGRGDRYLVNARRDDGGKIKVRVTDDPAQAKRFKTEALASAWGENTVLKLKSGWKAVGIG